MYVKDTVQIAHGIHAASAISPKTFKCNRVSCTTLLSFQNFNPQVACMQMRLGALVLVVNIPGEQRAPAATSARCSPWKGKMVVR